MLAVMRGCRLRAAGVACLCLARGSVWQCAAVQRKGSRQPEEWEIGRLLGWESAVINCKEGHWSN